jgi:putative endonuclease
MPEDAKSNQNWFFYIIKCRDGSFYSGITNDLLSRVEAHNKGTGAKYTSGRRPVILVFNEQYPNQSEAGKREAQVKSWSRQKKKQLIAGQA